ncbi:MAG: hypothetical protein LC746_02525 [Acidobacteria bacterium]|nr:hypothetical protein [Acidobacteriota bacterium]
MLKKISLAALLFAFLLTPLTSASAKRHHKHGRRHAYADGRWLKVKRTHRDDRNETPGVPRRLRRGRHWTPGTPRGPLTPRASTPTTFPRGEGRALGRDIMRREGRGGGIGRGIGGGRGRGKH